MDAFHSFFVFRLMVFNNLCLSYVYCFVKETHVFQFALCLIQKSKIKLNYVTVQSNTINATLHNMVAPSSKLLICRKPI